LLRPPQSTREVNVPALVTVSELKTYLGLTGSNDDALLASVASNATAIAQDETGRIFAVESNVTRTYSTDGQASLVVHDMPREDATRVVSYAGVDQTEDTGYWLLPDRRSNEVSTIIQLRRYDVGWANRSYSWFDANLDSPRAALGDAQPNNLVITGTWGHPTRPDSVFENIRRLAALLYWQAKAGASGIVSTPTGEEIDVAASRPPGWDEFVTHWRIRTAVVLV
jgi:hypothetical protein